MKPERGDHWLSLDETIEAQLQLQVKIAYEAHHAFLIAHGLRECRTVFDIGTGNGEFLRRLAHDHPELNFKGLDKRGHLIERFLANRLPNMEAIVGDAFGEHVDWSPADAVLMRYFLLHVPNAKDLLQRLRTRLKPGACVWVIDVDLSQFECHPRHPGFECLRELVTEFCARNSIDTFAGQKLGGIFGELGFTNIQQENLPFSTRNTQPDDLAAFLRQEAICYAHLLGRRADDPALLQINEFIYHQVRGGSADLSYGMVLWSARV